MTNQHEHAGLQQSLASLFGDRVSFQKVERLVYSHDMGVMPEQIRKMINYMPDAVVQPVNKDELIQLCRIAREHSVALIPRGAGTGGFGGAVPTKNGIVVDFCRMRHRMEIHEGEMTVTVDPGVVWEDLQKHLVKHGFSLRLTPSSARAATVAGWVAQGGSGYGSFEYSFFKDNLKEVEVVLPNGEITTFHGPDLSMVYGLCGITGFITSVTLYIRETDMDVVRLAAFASLEDLGRAMVEIKEQEVPLWSATLTTPSFVQLKQNAAQHFVLPQDHYLLTAVYPKKRKAAVESKLEPIIKNNNGQFMSLQLAQEEWDDRFYPMRFKKLGPSLVASEVIVPIDKLVDFAGEIEKKYRGEFALEGTMVGNDRIALLGFMLTDERKAGFPLAYANSLSVIALGEKLGGRVYNIGMYFTDRAETMFDQDTLQRIWTKKKEIDPHGLMNPGKVIPPSMDRNSPIKGLVTAMKAADAAKGLVGLAGKLMLKVQGEDFVSPFSEEITHDTFACALCGYCRNTCSVYDTYPWESRSPRGKYYLLNQIIKGNILLDEEVAAALFQCTTCKRCDFVCQVKSHNAENWLSLRPCFHAAGLENTGLQKVRENVLTVRNFFGVPAEEKIKWLDVPVKDKGKVAFWSGCFANAIMSNMSYYFTRVLDKIGVEFVHFKEREGCCGLYLALGGYMEDFVENVKKNIALFNEAGIETIVLACPGCYATFSENYPHVAKQLGLDFNIKIKHATIYLNELVESGKLKFDQPLDCTVTYHDSCHVGRWFGVYDEPRNVIKAIPGVELKEMEHNREESLCCGLMFAFDYLPGVTDRGMKKLAEAEATGAQYLITNCGGCGSQFNAVCAASGSKVKQVDLAELIAMALSIPTYDQTPTVMKFMQGVAQAMQDSRMFKVG